MNPNFQSISITLINNIRVTLSWIFSWLLVSFESSGIWKMQLLQLMTEPKPESFLFLDLIIKLLTIVSLMVAIIFTIKKGVVKNK